MTTQSPQIATNTSQQSFTAIFRILVIAAAGMAALLALLPAAGHDQLWFLMMGRRWLAGASIYGPEIFDSNPPLIVWLSSIPVAVAHALHLSTTFTAKLLVTLLETATSILSLYFLRRARPNTRTYEIPALLFAAITLFYVVPARDFGQRDHILSFLILPYVLAAAIPYLTQALNSARALAGILAAVAICLKPHHALIPIAIELALLATPSNLISPTLEPQQTLLLIRLRNLIRPETILIAILGACFLASIHHFAPLYFTSALPILRNTYWAIGHLTFPGLAFEAIELLVLATISLALTFRFKPTSPLIPLLQLAAFAATIAYFIQATGWYYQQLPAISIFGVALTLQLLDLLATKSLNIPTWLPKATAALTVLALALTTHFTGYPFTADRAFAITNPDPSFFTTLPPNTSVAILTTSVEAAMMPIERYHLTWAQRTNNLWLLPAILRSEEPPTNLRSLPNASTTLSSRPERSAVERPAVKPARLSHSTIAALDTLQHRWMVEDLTRWQPQLILIHRCQDPAVHCQELEDRHDNLLAWFQRDPAFATLWTHYTFSRTQGEFDAYTRKKTN
jgi:hypothetical protein